MTDKARHPKRPRDANQLAHSVVDEATMVPSGGNAIQGKDPAAVSLGRRGGLKGGAARSKKLTAEQRKLIASKAAQARWRANE